MFTLESSRDFRHISIDKISTNPYQPRKNFNDEALDELTESVRSLGIIQPITVRRTSIKSCYEIVSGERRFRAAARAGLEKVPCVILDVGSDVSAIMALVENLQRKDLDFFEEGEAILRLIQSFNLTQEAVAAQIGRTQPSVANKLRLLRIPPYMRERIVAASLTERHARALLRLKGEDEMGDVLETVINRKLNVADTERLIERRIARSEERVGRTVSLCRDVRICVNTINNALSLILKSGVKALSERMDEEDFIVYNIKIPKKLG